MAEIRISVLLDNSEWFETPYLELGDDQVKNIKEVCNNIKELQDFSIIDITGSLIYFNPNRILAIKMTDKNKELPF